MHTPSQMHDGKTSSAASATSVATLVQLRLQYSATDSAPDQARQSDDTIASARVADMKIEGLNDHQRTESCITQLKEIKNSTNVSRRQSRSVA